MASLRLSELVVRRWWKIVGVEGRQELGGLESFRARGQSPGLILCVIGSEQGFRTG